MGLSSYFFRFMQILLLSLILFRSIAAHFTSSNMSLCHDNERFALLQFQKSLIINENASDIFPHRPCHPKFISWKPEEGNIDCCSWDGVECNEKTGHVIKLDISNSCLYSSINSSNSLFHLVHLEWLNLAYNNFRGSKIPSAIMNLSELSYLNLSGSFFSGQIPSEILELSNLVSLDLSGNLDFPLFHLELKKPSLGNLLEKLSNLKKLDLREVTIASSIPHNLGSLSHSLTFLSLIDCQLQGKIPSSIGNLTKLIHLDLSINELMGELPTSIGNLVMLKQLKLSSNKFSGELPALIGNIRSLEVLDISSCNFSGQIPSSFSNLTQLSTLDLSENSFTGTMDLDMFLTELKHLDVLALSSNKLSLLTRDFVNATSQKFSFVGLRSCNITQFPNFLENQHHLQVLDLSSNKIQGKIPKWLMKKSMSYLNLSHNILTGFDGQYPFVFPRSTYPFTLDLGSNNLQGPLPIPPTQTINYMVLNNSFTGELPTWICKLKILHTLDLAHNNLSGELPKCLGNFSSPLFVLQLKNNKFSGSIPQTFKNGSVLRMIDLSNNLLRGKIPRSLANCKELEFLDLGNNQISDTFPSWLGTLPNLNVLILQSNRLHGTIRKTETGCVFPKLRIIDISVNRFSGKLPSKYFECWNAMKVVNKSQLTYMQVRCVPIVIPFLNSFGIYDYVVTLSNKGKITIYENIPNIFVAMVFSSNKFDGEIPASLADLRELQSLNLSNNNLQGHIPSFLSNLTNLESLDLSSNKLSGQIPQNLVDLTFLEFFDVSHNDLTGLIPQGNQFTIFENSSFDGNSGLCGKPLSKKCENDSKTAERAEGEYIPGLVSPFAFDWIIVLIGYSGGLIVGVILGISFSTGIQEWFMEKFGKQSKRIRQKTRPRN